MQANPHIVRLSWRLKQHDVKLSRKTSMVNYIGARTVNRHRWVGREY